MNFNLTDEQKMIQESAREFANKEFPALIAKYERPGLTNEEYKELFKILLPKLRDAGFLGVTVPEKYGGLELDTMSALIIMKEITEIWGSASLIFAVSNSLCGYPLTHFANEEQKINYLMPLVNGEKIGCYCLTEGHGGSAPHFNRTTATETENGIIIEGSKYFITQPNVANYAIVFANNKSIKTEPGKEYRQSCAFLVDTNTPGCRIEKIEDKLGLHASPTCLISFNKCKIPKKNLLGRPGKGIPIALATLGSGRMYIAAQGWGFMNAAYKMARKYCETRKPEGFPISDYPAIKNYLNCMKTNIDKAQKLLYYVATLKDQEEKEIEAIENTEQREERKYSKKKFIGYASLAKYFITEAAVKTALSGIRILGGCGYTTEFEAGRLLLDSIATILYEGSNEIQEKVIENELNIKPHEIELFVDNLITKI